MKWRNELGGVLEMSEREIRAWRDEQKVRGLPHDQEAFRQAHGLVAFGNYRTPVIPERAPAGRRGRRQAFTGAAS